MLDAGGVGLSPAPSAATPLRLLRRRCREKSDTGPRKPRAAAFLAVAASSASFSSTDFSSESRAHKVGAVESASDGRRFLGVAKSGLSISEADAVGSSKLEKDG